MVPRGAEPDLRELLRPSVQRRLVPGGEERGPVDDGMVTQMTKRMGDWLFFAVVYLMVILGMAALMVLAGCVRSLCIP